MFGIPRRVFGLQRSMEYEDVLEYQEACLEYQDAVWNIKQHVWNTKTLFGIPSLGSSQMEIYDIGTKILLLQ